MQHASDESISQSSLARPARVGRRLDCGYVDFARLHALHLFLTNHMALPALTIAALSKSRLQVELFFEWIKQHLRIKHFMGNSENAVKTQVWCAVATYVLIAKEGASTRCLSLDLSTDLVGLGPRENRCHPPCKPVCPFRICPTQLTN
jgi:DDE family transposase